MGLDSVELVLAAEDRFDITITLARTFPSTPPTLGALARKWMGANFAGLVEQLRGCRRSAMSGMRS